MKKNILLAALLFASGVSFAQTYEMTVTTKGGVQYTVPASDVISVEFEQAAETLGPIPSGIDLSNVFSMSTTHEMLKTSWQQWANSTDADKPTFHDAFEQALQRSKFDIEPTIAAMLYDATILR